MNHGNRPAEVIPAAPSSPLPTLLLFSGSLVGLALLGPTRATLFAALPLYSVAFLALLRLWRAHSDLLEDPRILLGGALVLRLLFFPTLPDLSDDAYRYLWDGWLTASGINPFLFPPLHPALADFQADPLFEALNSPEYHSIYPPLSQLVFLVGGLAYEGWGWPASAYLIKGGFLLLECGGIVALYFALRSLRIPVSALALYAWNPLVLLMVAGGGHTEGGLTLGLGLLALGVARGRRRLSWIGLVLAVASKGFPLLLAPLLLRHQLAHHKQRGAGWPPIFRDALPGLILGIALAAPFYAPGALRGIASSAELYLRLFEFNGGPYLLLKEAAGWVTGEDLGKTIGPVLGALFLGAALWISVRWRVDRPTLWLRGGLLLFSLYLATATTVHPWYLIGGLALIPFSPFLRSTWLWASWAAFPTYLSYQGVPHGLLASLFWIGVLFFLLREGESGIRDRLLRIAGWRKARQIDRFLGEGTILDLGAGEGYLARHLVREDRNIFMVELGPYFRVQLPGLVYDGATLPILDRGVDTVLLSLALHHAEDPDRVLAEALRVARRRVVLTESTYRWGWERWVLVRLDRWANRGRGFEGGGEKPSPPLQFRTIPEWEAAFLRAGARLVMSQSLNRIGHRHHLFLLEPGGGVRESGAFA